MNVEAWRSEELETGLLVPDVSGAPKPGLLFNYLFSIRKAQAIPK